jgi:hypothetical protein
MEHSPRERWAANRGGRQSSRRVDSTEAAAAACRCVKTAASERSSAERTPAVTGRGAAPIERAVRWVSARVERKRREPKRGSAAVRR